MNKYEKLQSILNKCIEKWRKPFWWNKKCKFKINEWKIRIVAHNKDYSYHDLFSVDSWLMESVEWQVKWYSKHKAVALNQVCINPDIVWCTAKECYDCRESGYHYMIMSVMTAEQKIDYFLTNIIDE